MKTWNEVIVGDKVIAKAACEAPFVIYGIVTGTFVDCSIKIEWIDKLGEFVYPESYANSIHFYETESEKLALMLKLL
jgi:hypothetical protein